jgi:hypothetical protein|tara:strand:+ start:6835 stop:7821 length:987 start_codon:yes stop_codon:yes gene_type:complete
MLNTFKEVEWNYTCTNPVVSKYHTKEQDIRPLGNRRKKWERIVKVNNNCYALLSGFDRSDALRNRWYMRGRELDLSPEEVRHWAPIVWERHPDLEDRFGDPTETVTVRGTTRSHDQARLKFMRSYLPSEIDMPDSSTVRMDDIRMYLPRTNESDDGDKNFMVFERNTSAWGPRFYVASEEFVRPKIQSRIDKELKAKIKPHMDAFYEWVCAMAPILPSAPSWASSADVDDYHERAAKYREYRMNQTKKLVDVGVMTGFWNAKFVPERTIEAIVTEDTELRLALAVLFLETSELQKCKTKEDFKYARTQYNRWINKVCGLVTTTEVKGN